MVYQKSLLDTTKLYQDGIHKKKKSLSKEILLNVGKLYTRISVKKKQNSSDIYVFRSFDSNVDLLPFWMW